MLQARFFIGIFCVLLSTCTRVSNSIDAVHLDCGEPWPEATRYFKVSDGTGEFAARSDLEVLHMPTADAAPQPYHAVTSLACIAIPSEGYLLLRHKLRDLGLVQAASEIPASAIIPLLNLADQKLDWRCDREHPLIVSKSFTLTSILSKKLRPELEKTYRLGYRFADQSLGLADQSSLPISSDERSMPFAQATKDGLYQLDLVIDNWLQPAKNAEQSCLFQLDSTAPQVSLLLNGNRPTARVETHGTADILFVRETDTLEFKQEEGDDGKEIEYCVEPLNDDFEDASDLEQDAIRRDRWKAVLSSRECQGPWLTTPPHAPLRFTSMHHGFWTIKYRAVDHIGNRASLVQVQAVLLAHAGSMELARSLAETIYSQGMVPMKNLRFAIGNALRSESIRQSLPTKFERDSLAMATAQALLAVLGDHESITWELEGSNQQATGFSGNYAVVQSADHRLLVQATPHHDIRIYDTSSGQVIKRLDNQKEGMNGLAISEDGKWLAVASAQNTAILIWDLEKGEVARRLEGSASSHLLAFSPDASTLASAVRNGPVTLWDLTTGKPVSAFSSLVSTAGCLAFTASGKELATTAGDGTISIRSLPTGQEIKSFQESGQVTALLSVPGQPQILSGTRTGKIKLWNYETGTSLKNFDGHFGAINSLSWNKQGTAFYSSSADTSGRKWDLASGSQLEYFEDLPGNSIFFQDLREESVLVMADVRGSLHLRSLLAKPVRLPLADPGVAMPLLGTPTFSVDGRTLAKGTSDKVIRVWNTNSGAMTAALPVADVPQALALSGDGRWLVTAPFLSDAAELWDTVSQTRSQTLGFDDKLLKVGSVAMSPDQKWIALGMEYGQLRVHESGNGALAFAIPAHADLIVATSISPDGQFLVTAARNEVKLWKLADGKPVFDLLGLHDDVSSVAFSPDSRKVLATGRDRSVMIWNVKTGKLQKVLGGEYLPMDGYRALFNDDASLIYWNIGSQVDIWNLEYGVRLASLNSPDSIDAVGPTSDRRGLNLLSRTNELIRFDLNNASLVQKICSASARFLTKAELDRTGGICP